MISLRVSATNLANTNRIENPRDTSTQCELAQQFSEVGENKQLLIAIVVLSLFFKFHVNYINYTIRIGFNVHVYLNHFFCCPN